MTSPKSRSVCIFCGGTPLSNEHLFPQWVTRLLIDSPKGFPAGRQSYAKVTKGKEVSRWDSSTPLAFTVRTVCERCNNGWMSEIENEAKQNLEPMIKASSVITLDEQAQRLVATWMGLRLLMVRSSDKHPWPTVVYEWADWFYTKHTVPPNWNIWIGAYDGILPAYFESAPIHPFTDSTRASLHASDFRGFVFTSIMGYLAFKVGALSRAEVFNNSGSALIRIAPPESAQVEWPPDRIEGSTEEFRAITDESILKFFGMGLSSPPNLAKYWDEIQKS